ncbi:MAG: Mpo1-like protein, partial [Candidatus Binatia bacterium]
REGDRTMRTIDEWLDTYGASHQNPVNKLIHRIAVPIIVVDALGFLHMLPTAALASWLPPASWLLIVGTLAFYTRLSPGLAVGMLMLVLPGMAALDAGLAALGAWALPALVAVFAVTWIAQFIGHAIEGQKPSFFEDVQFLLIGPLWLLADAYRRLGISVGPERQTA